MPRTGSLIVEGCGAISRASRALADHAWWLELDDAERKRRALERDGDAFAPHWDRWAAQEDAVAAPRTPARRWPSLPNGERLRSRSPIGCARSRRSAGQRCQVVVNGETSGFVVRVSPSQVTASGTSPAGSSGIGKV